MGQFQLLPPAPLVWYFCSKNLLNKIENIQKRFLKFHLNDCESDYKKFTEKSNKWTMEVKRLGNLALETFKTLNDLNRAFMKNLFA